MSAENLLYNMKDKLKITTILMQMEEMQAGFALIL